MEPEARRQRRLNSLNDDHPVCAGCGENDRRILERHHIAGRRFGEDTVLVCRNCHGRETYEQAGHPGPTSPDPGSLERLAHFLLGLADFFRLLADRLAEFARMLLDVESATPDGGTA
jgi:hypothetical protein